MWDVFLVETLTGRVGAKVPAAAGGSWSDTINGPTEISVTVPTPWLLKQDRRWWGRLSGSLLACCDGEPIALGPIMDEPAGDRELTTLAGGGLWSLLERRIVTDGDITDGPALAASTAGYNEGSLGTIARRLVEDCQRRPQGWLPVAYDSPAETGTNRTRNYQGFNLGNNDVAKRLGEITEVINGPDIAFRPRWAERDVSVVWAMVHGTEAVPEIATDRPYHVDLAAPQSDAVAVQVTAAADGWQRAYATGEGQDEAMLIRVESTGQLAPGMPFTETVVADSQVTNADLLSGRARAKLGTSRTVQVQADVWADPASMPLHTWWAGDLIEVSFGPGWPQLPAGTYPMRALSRSGDMDGYQATVEFQVEEVTV